MKPGPRNAITDVAGVRVGHAQDAALKSGSTVLLGDAPFTAGVHVMGGAPGTRETDLLAPDKSVQQVDALVLSGGSAFGLDAASGVADGLRAIGRGFPAPGAVVPIVPSAILFDLANGGDKAWIENPYKALGRAALNAASVEVAIGSVGAGAGATSATLKGGLGTASVVVGDITIGALVAVNPLGAVTVEDTHHFWAAPFEMDAEFGNLGPAPRFNPAHIPPQKPMKGGNTTIAIIVTDATLTQAQCTRLAIAAHDGMARAIVPSHTPHDGDLVFAGATGTKPAPDPMTEALLGHFAATCLSRAIARAIYAAAPAQGDLLPTWHQKFS